MSACAQGPYAGTDVGLAYFRYGRRRARPNNALPHEKGRTHSFAPSVLRRVRRRAQALVDVVRGRMARAALH